MRLGAFVLFKVFYNLHKLCEEIIQIRLNKNLKKKYLLDSVATVFLFKTSTTYVGLIGLTKRLKHFNLDSHSIRNASNRKKKIGSDRL